VLQASYTSVETRAAELYPFVIGVRHLVRDKYDSLSKIGSVEAPLLMLHGAKDAIIPLRHGEPRRTNLKPWWFIRRRIMTITAANRY
jgi:uncharacterized protein